MTEPTTETPALIGPTALAKALGVSRNTVHLYAREGKITGHAGKYDLDEVRAQLAVNLGTKRGGVPRRGDRGNTANTANLSNLAKSDLEKEALSERIRGYKLRNDREHAELISAAEVEASWTDIAARIQSSVLGIPARLANRLPTEWRREVMAVAEDEIRQILTALAHEIGTDTKAA